MAFEEIKAKLGLDITDFEKGMLDANRAAKQAAAAQAKLADFRRAKALEEASDLGRVKILQGELVQLYNLRKTAVAGSAPYLAAQLEIEKKMVEIGKARAQQKASELQANQQLSAPGRNLTAAIKASGGAAAAGAVVASGGVLATLEARLPKIVGGIKAIGGALGASGALAGLIPGLGWASAAVAAVVFGVNKLKDYTAEVAARAKEIRDIMESMGKTRFQRAFDAMDDKQKLKTLEDQVDQADQAWKLSVLTARNGEDDLRSAKAAEALEKARNALADHKKSMQEKAAQDAKAEADQVDAINKARSDALSEEMEKKHGLRYLQMRLVEAEKEAAKPGLTKLQQAQALQVVDEARKKVKDKIDSDENEMNKNVAEFVSWYIGAQDEMNQKDKDRTKNLKDQKDLLEAQARLKAEEIRAARIQDVKPTMEEVTSGKRNIGIGARENARRLQREQEKSLRLADQTQRAFEAIDQAKTPSERRDAQRTWNASRLALEASQERIKRGQEMLGTRIADANPYATMEAELKSIKTELTTLNKTTLAPTSTK